MSKYFTFELWQGGMVVASVTAVSREDAEREIVHYATMYGQDGPIEIKEKVRKKMK